MFLPAISLEAASESAEHPVILQPSVQDLEARVGKLFTPSRLASVFEFEIAPSSLRGLDRVGSAGFRQHRDRETRVIARKVLGGSYRFTPYRELLRPRGAKKPPRRLAVATVRDRIVLYTLKELLHEAFPDAVNRTAPNKLIRDIRTDAPRLQDAAFVKTDIRSFYDSIDQKLMLDTIAPKLPSSILRLIERALRNPTLAHGNRRLRHLTPLAKGVPQGLAISNILAEIYLHSLDQVMHTVTLTYRRCSPFVPSRPRFMVRRRVAVSPLCISPETLLVQRDVLPSTPPKLGAPHKRIRAYRV